MAKASQVVLSENEFYLIKAPNGKVLEVKNFNTENGAAIRLWDYAGHPIKRTARSFMSSADVKSELHQIFIVYFVTSRIVSHSILWYHTPVCLMPTFKGGVSCSTLITKPL